MEFFEKVTMDGLKAKGVPTFNKCEHFYVKPHPGTMQTLVIEIEGGKFLTVCIVPDSDNVDVKMHGDHRFSDFGTVKAFFNMKGDYDK